VRLAIVINENLGEPSAHMLYMLRLASGLAAHNPLLHVDLLYPQGRNPLPPLSYSGTNLSLYPLPAIRKPKGGRGLTLNFVFYYACLWQLQALAPDIIFSASFNKLWRFLLSHRNSLPKHTRWVYELHELVELNSAAKSAKIKEEVALLRRSDLLLATTGALIERLATHQLKAKHLPLACGYSPADFTGYPEPAHGPFRLGYFGSTYAGQGVDWLIEHWQGPAELHIWGNRPAGLLDRAGVVWHPYAPMSEVLPEALPLLHALVIPALPQGRMPYVAFTKSYDYLAFGRPILASGLPSITEVLLPGKHALTFTPGDISSFRQQLGLLMGSAALRQELALAAQRRASELSWPARIARLASYLGV
jgi:glycosyltransferase involved in cell wall biosynthesis